MSQPDGRTIAAVTFDVDGTLYSLRRLRLRFALRYPWRVPVSLAMARAREGLRRENLARLDLAEELDRRTAALLRCTPARAMALRERIVLHDWPATLRRVGPYPGLRVLLERLVARGIRLGVISDYPASAKLEALGLADLPWALQLDSTTIGALKPRPELFAQALGALALPAQRVLHVGDRYDADVAGARSVGMHAALRLDAPEELQLADGLRPLCFSGYGELQRQLEPLLLGLDG